MKNKIFLLLLLNFLISKSFAQQDTLKIAPNAAKEPLPKGAVQFTPDQIQWTDAPQTLPKGSKMCILYGDLKNEGPFAVRFKLPANQIIKPHMHSNDEVVTVLEGAVSIGFGERMQLSKTKEFTAGSFYVNPGRTAHYVVIQKDGATVQINSIGPWMLDFK